MRFLVSPEQKNLLQTCQQIPKPELKPSSQSIQPFISWLELAIKECLPVGKAKEVAEHLRGYRFHRVGYDSHTGRYYEPESIDTFLQWIQEVSRSVVPDEGTHDMIASIISYRNSVEEYQQSIRQIICSYWIK